MHDAALLSIIVRIDRHHVSKNINTRYYELLL